MSAYNDYNAAAKMYHEASAEVRAHIDRTVQKWIGMNKNATSSQISSVIHRVTLSYAVTAR